ncbi:peptidoglycan-binding protein [Actinocrispum wychmicini]|uniref:D-alanyl-D-alanine carboxypeptidase-like protein n=1 Tax=Actinocrispum wychmicini TaxID=1213861 RepID=A0A4R2J3F3_9PSEU|nr:peptidoglycan-binding protein [Actinocrispum wychmicini]TCO52983.1 D-alanyl-D-alanine carboxypeptidase-like protein [Actinocrispum wychmicini]
MTVSQNGWPIDPPRTARLVDGTNTKLIVVDGPGGDILMYVARQFSARVESLDAPGPADDWGYAHRVIAGTRVWSNHASATAIDLNATQHPSGKRGTFNANQVAAIRAILSECGGLIRWGGDYSGGSPVDEMHWEIVGNFDQVAEWVRNHGNPGPSNRPTLSLGSTGDDVRDVQRVLNAWYPRMDPLVVDGVFGALTRSRVVYAQERLGLKADGIVGPLTWSALGFR